MKTITVTLATFFLLGFAFAQNDAGSAIRASLNLNGTWQFVTNQAQSPIPNSGWQPMRAPSAPWMDGTPSVWYKQTIFIPATWVVSGRRFFLELEKCGHYCAVYVNGIFAGDHYGQYAPYEAEVTVGISPGANVEFEIYSHIADDNYTRRGVVLNQEASCGSEVPLCESASYRPEGLTPNARNWVGIVGDITFSWRGGNNEYIQSAQILTSFRNSTITANISVAGAGPNATVSAAVFDNGVDVLDLPAEPVFAGAVTLQSSWTNAILWSQANPHLYQLQTTLNDGGVQDQKFDRFGFREVWAAGKQLLLNGKPLWMVGSFLETESDLRWSNDRDPEAMQFFIQQQSGLNADTYHWDSVGREWNDLRDEMGVPAMNAMYCNGPQNPAKAKVDSQSAWISWMAEQAAETVRAEQNNPAIVVWRPLDVYPAGAGAKQLVDPQIKAAMVAVNPTILLADNSDVATWAQSVQQTSNPRLCDNGQAFSTWLSQQTVPALIREIFGGYGLPCLSTFYQTIYRDAYNGGAAGIFIQQLPLANPHPFTPSWPSESGIGNRLTVQDLPNWISRQWSPTQDSTGFAKLYTRYTRQPIPVGSPVNGEYVATGIPASADTAFVEPAFGEVSGVVVYGDGSAWFDTEFGGWDVLDYEGSGGDVLTSVDVVPPAPF